VSITSDTEVSFFVLSSDAYNAWINQKSCNVDNPIEETYAVTSYSSDVVIPKDGVYEFLFLNFSKTRDAGVKFSALIAANAVVVSSIETKYITLQSYSTGTDSRFATRTLTSTSIGTEQVGMFSMGDQSLLLIVAVVAIVAVVVGFMLYRSRSRKGAPTIARQQTAGSFCINCSNPLPQGAKFCNKCGATQP
jgi:ribosomal protein L40E